jgi:hypothetical protein
MKFLVRFLPESRNRASFVQALKKKRAPVFESIASFRSIGAARSRALSIDDQKKFGDSDTAKTIDAAAPCRSAPHFTDAISYGFRA